VLGTRDDEDEGVLSEQYAQLAGLIEEQEDGRGGRSTRARAS
jgi:hypothetical protein